VLARPARKVKKDLEPVEKEFERIAKRLKKPGIARSDNRFPMHVIFSSREGLARQYGMQTALVIENEMANLVEIVKRRPGWGAMAFIADDAENAARLGVQPVDSVDPWKLKLALVDLDQRLASKGAMIGSVLIIGGPKWCHFTICPTRPMTWMMTSIPTTPTERWTRTTLCPSGRWGACRVKRGRTPV
jgi:hypothetical protein